LSSLTQYKQNLENINLLEGDFGKINSNK
jgi:hypothetical protein